MKEEDSIINSRMDYSNGNNVRINRCKQDKSLCTCITRNNDKILINDSSDCYSHCHHESNHFDDEIASRAIKTESSMSPFKLSIIKMLLIIRTIFRTVQQCSLRKHGQHQQCNMSRRNTNISKSVFNLVIILVVNCLLIQQVSLVECMDLDGSLGGNGVNSLTSSEHHSAAGRQQFQNRRDDTHVDNGHANNPHHDMDDDNDDSSSNSDNSHHHLFNGNHVREPLVAQQQQHQQQSNAINRSNGGSGSSSNDENSNSGNNNAIQHHQDFHPQFYGPQSLHNNQLLNYTLMLQELERGCSSYCADQIPFSSICITKGCRNWKTGLRQGCSFVCNGSENNFREFYACQVGCSKAIEEYYFRVTGLIGVPDPPTLISDSLKSSSLRLSWEGSALPLPYLVYSVQRRVFPRTSQWETIPMSQSSPASSTSSQIQQQQQQEQQSPLNTTTFTVTSLKPYTEYQFRIGWIIAHDFPPYYSRESNPIETLPKGLPNPPEITSIQPISNTSVSVTWHPPSQPNGRLIAYILKLRKLPDGHIIIKEIPISQNPRGYTFTGLQPITNYSLEISAQNVEGEGETANIHFVTPQSSLSNDISEKPEPRLLLQGIKDVYMQHLDLLLDPDVFVYNSSQNISAIAGHIKYKWVFIATDDGDILRKGLDQSQHTLIVRRSRLDLEVAFLAVDWLHNQLYIVGKKWRSTNWSIKKCDLNGNNLVTIYTYLFERPIDFAADPYTGYLYWVSPSTQMNRGGLFKLDLVSDEFANGLYPVPVIEGQDLGPFVVDSVNYRILIVHKGRNTVLAVSLDGDVTDIRRNTQSPQFEDALSIAWYNGIFYWTTGQSVVVEEYNAAQDNYYQNSYDVAKVHQPCTRLMIVHPDLQPTPVPMAPPQRVQVIYGQTRARVSWRPPPVISGLGEGSWRQWSYQIKVVDTNVSFGNISTSEFVIQNLRPSTFYTIQVSAASPGGRGPWSPPLRGKSLRETPFNITFLWGSQSGLYMTNTLGENVELLASPSIWLGNNYTGNPSVDKFTPQGSLPTMGSPLLNSGTNNSPSGFIGLSSLYMSSLTWFDSLVFFALSNGSVFYYDTMNVIQDQQHLPQGSAPSSPHRNEITRLAGVPNAQSIAFDYIGQKLYWSNPKQQTILRCSFIQGSVGVRNNLAMNVETLNPCTVREKAERLQVVTMAREISVDSYKGLLLWSTGHSLELSRLNGYSHRTLYQTGLFSGIHIMGITLDTDQSRIYWITRSSTGSTLQRLNYNIRGAQVPMIIANYDDTSISGPIRYFNDRLIWLQGPSEAVITDLYGQGKSSLSINTISNITNLHVRDQSAQRYPGGLSKTKIQVYPDPILKWTIGITGKWNNFTISWTPVNNTNYGKILYEVIVNNSISKITASPNMTIDNGTLFKPYSDLEITVTSLTFWASSKPVSTRLKTPSWRPSEPLNPRVFVKKLGYPYLPSKLINNLSTGGSSPSVSVELRWDVPLQPNGLILGYLTHCWKDTMKKTDCSCEVDRNTLQQKPSCEIHNLAPSSKYYFAIQAYTDNGAGNLSNKILADTSFNTPVPNLMLVTADKLQILDIDRNDVNSLPFGYLNPTTAVHFAKENSIFWFNEGQDLMWSKVGASNNKTRIKSLASMGVEASNLVVDWIGRKLYWAYEVTSSPPASTSSLGSSGEVPLEENYGIMSFDLVPSWGLPQKPKVVLSSKTPVRSVAVNPFRKSLFWTTARRNGITTLFTSEIDGTSPRAFLSRDPVTCNCSSLSSTGEPIAYDPHGLGGSLFPSGILFMDKQGIWLSDDNGCNCVRVANLNTLPFLQNSPYRIAADQHRVYWAEGSLFASEKMGNGAATELQPVGAGVREVSIFGPISQPYPDLSCLLPQKLEPIEPILFNHSSFSLHLQLPKPETVNCSLGEVSLPTPKYNVFYGTVDENGISECTPTSSSFCKVKTTLESMLHITDLHPYTTYTVFVTLTNYYAEQEGEKSLGCPPIMFRTAPGVPMPPTLLRVEPLTPVSVRVVWRQPEKLNGEKVWYEVNWKTSGTRTSSPKYSDSDRKWAETETKSNHNRTEYYLDLLDLVPENNYTIWVRAYSEKGDAFSESEQMFVSTFPPPNNITLVKASPHNLSLSWIPPNDTSILRHQVMYRDGWSTQWNYTELIDFTIPSTVYKLNITNLKPKTLYGFRIKTWYIGNPKADFDWPAQGQFNFETLADKPGIPGKPIARGIGRSLYEITWEKAAENGAEIEMYSLECKVEIDQSMVSSSSASSAGGNGANTETGHNQSIGVDYVLMNTTEYDNANKKQLVRHRRDAANGIGTSAAEKLISSEGADDNERIWTGVFLQWVTVYNGTDARWQVEGLDINKQYSFRVRAKNVYGWGEYSQETISVSLAALTLVADSQGFGIVLGSIFVACFIIGTCIFLILFLYRGKLKEKPILNGPMSSSERREVELATLSGLPQGSTFIHQSNILYAGDLLLDMDMDFAGVAKIHKHQINFGKKLGRGAFGEVYEGVASGLIHMHEETRVAIKTLRKGASSFEKVEFIQEAKLMMQFQHPHIIQLMGICVDTDPCCLLLELMSGGDLLSYLRSHRPHHGSTTSLTIVDLLRMCVDVAKGCVYLEEMHFVHRDLAARNCLVHLENVVSNSTGENSPDNGVDGQCRRIVKIGDFGLARDIYRNDYYRKEGEGLLPVRWMAPESLIDGVFTTQSDVWSFGVILWEIMTLGQQPYPARNNLEVLHYVQTGGRLHQPVHCSPALSQLMLRCWEFQREYRPSFRECLSDLESILKSYECVMMNGHLHQSPSSTVSQIPDTDKEEDEYGFRSPMSSQPVSSNRRLNYRTESAPKYIEVIAEPGGAAEGGGDLSPYPLRSLHIGINEGYEIPLPRKPPRRKAAEVNLSFSASSQSSSHSPAPEYGLPSPKYWNVDVSSPGSSFSQNFKRSNSASSNLPLLHRSSSGGGAGASSSSTLTITETRNEAFIQDSYEDVQYTAVSCPDYHLHLAQHHHPLSQHYYHRGGHGGCMEDEAVGGVSHLESKCSVEARINSPDAGDLCSSTTTAENSPVYAYTYRSIPAPTSSTNYSQNLDYHRHNNIANQPGFSRQTIDTCGSG